MENNKRVFGDNPIARVRIPNESRILTTPEAIVREHRERWFNLEARKQINTDSILDREIKRIEIERRLMMVKMLRKLRKMINRINWTVATEWLWWALVISALATIIGVVVFGPTSWREFWK